MSIVVEQTTRSGDLAVSVFGTDQGLPQNDLDAVVIAPDGVVWAGVDLDEGWSWARLDDGRFVTVGVSPARGSQFAAGPDGELWMFGPWGFGSPGVQHFDGTDWSFDPETGIVDSLDSAAMPFASFDGVSWTRLSTPPRPVNASAANPAVAPDGTVWVRLDRGLAWFDGEVWSSTVDLDPDGVVERRAIDVADLAFDDECTVDEAIGRLPLSTDPSIAINDLSQLVAGFAGDTSGQLWTATSCLGVTRTDPVAGEASVFTTQDGLPSLGFRDIAAHPDGSVWVVSDSALVRLAPIS